jgi:adenosine deaminase
VSSAVPDPAASGLPLPAAEASSSRRPLVDLHRHLEGAVRVSTVLELARREHHPLAATVSPREALVAGGRLTDLVAYLERVDAAAAVFTRAADWTRAAREVVLDAYDEGLDALELRFSPWFIRSRTGLHPEAVIDAVATGVAEARALVGLPVGLIGILLRDLGPDSALPQLDSILRRAGHFGRSTSRATRPATPRAFSPPPTTARGRRACG